MNSEFSVLMAKNHVKRLMGDLRISKLDLSKPYDHVGIIDADSSNKALFKKIELESAVGKLILSIEVARV